MPRRILIVAANLKIAGAQKMIEQLVLHLNPEAFRIRVVVLSNRQGTVIEKKLEDAGIDVRYLGKQPGFSIAILKRMQKELDEFSPDLVHTHVNSWLYILPAVFTGKIRMLHTIHSSPERQEKYGFLRMIIKYLYKTQKAIPVAISDKIRDEAVTVYGIPLCFIERIYNPVDCKTISTLAPKAHSGVVFVNVARFCSIKNQLFLIKCFSKVYEKIPQTKLVFAGEGELLYEATQLVQTLNLSHAVEFRGNVDDIPALLAECDVFVLPSLSEGMPISLLEAEAASLPVIASRVGGIPDVVDSNGILVEVNCEKDLVEAMLTLASDSEDRKNRGIRSKEIAAQYSSEVIAKEYEVLYEKYGSKHQ